MTEIKLEKRYPHSRMEDITDAFMRGYQQGKEDEHRWWSNHCANCKDAEQTEPQTGIKQFADILFDKDAQEQFLKECEAMGITTDCAWK